MFRILVMNLLLISLILIWTSAAREPSAGTLIKSSAKLPTGPLNYSASKPLVFLNETLMDIRSPKTLCSLELSGVCVKKKKSCPSHLPSQKSPGKPYCSKKYRCCYPDVNWSVIRNACIKSNNYKTYTTSTIDLCKEKCVEEEDINCHSIEYSSEQQMCSISEARSDSVDFTEPCFVDGWVFAERESNKDNCIDKKGKETCEYWENNFKYCSQGKFIGYMAIYCKKTCLKCEDKKECEVNNGGCDHICTDTIGSYICSCQEGYNLDGDQITCIDNKECEVNNGGCDHICTDTIGSYICSCQEGYTLDDDQITCIDVNWSGIKNACIKSNNYKTYTTSTIDLCKEKCVEEEDINCQSIEYSSEQQMCSISEARSDSDDFIEPCFVDGWVFAERGAPSCNLVWNYKEERPLIMIRNSTTIVPPIIDMDVSTDPNRIPIGRKLIFACPGKNNHFNNFPGTHTKLHGECISHEQFKVCFNNNPVKLNLSQLSCSRKMHPSFIKDNATSDKNSCDGIGGEPYKQGYTYGDKHEFKDLEIGVCFSKKNQTTLCTSSNLNGNETDYRNAIKEHSGRDPRMDPLTQCGPTDPVLTTDQKIIQLIEVLFPIDLRKNNLHAKLTINKDGEDGDKLISSTIKPPELFKGETYAALIELQLGGDYKYSVKDKETITQIRSDKQDAFIKAIMDTEVMRETELFLLNERKISSKGELSDVMKKMWFTLYSRTSTSTPGSSGFEHTFRGEIKNKEVKGFHNWVFTFHQQQFPKSPETPNFVYKPKLVNSVDLYGKTIWAEPMFTWHGRTKYVQGGGVGFGSTIMFIGTSPEFEMAVYTVCFLMKPKPDDICSVRIAGQMFTIITQRHKNTEFLGGAFPILPRLKPTNS